MDMNDRSLPLPKSPANNQTGTDLSPVPSHLVLASSTLENYAAITTKKPSIHAFYHQTLSLFRDALKSGGCPHCLIGHARTQTENNISRLYMWAQGLDLLSFGRKIDKDSELQSIVAGTLARIAEILTSGTKYVSICKESTF